MSLPVGAHTRAKLVGGLLIAGGMYGAELTGAPGSGRELGPAWQGPSAESHQEPGGVWPESY
eukprot:263750-Heterocapsa_arctica.AAC.1